MRWIFPLSAVLLTALACSTFGGPASEATRVATPAATAAPALTATLVLPTPGGAGSKGSEAILILEPGPQSGVTSPVRVAGQADPTFEQNLVVQISNADGIALATSSTTIHAATGQRGLFTADVPFSVTADEPGRISVFSTSARDGGLIHLASMEVTLLASGPASINPPQPHAESLAVFEPALLSDVSGGVLHLAGFSDYVFENQLGVFICGEGGSGAPHFICGTEDNVLATGGAYVHSPDFGQPGPLDGDVPYRLPGPMRARLVIYDASPRDGAYTHAASVEMTLRP